MTIPTQMSLHGFVVKEPRLTFIGEGAARFYARVGVDHFRRETDGSFTKLEPTFHDLVMFGRPAERAYGQFKVGDQFIASGYVNEYEYDGKGMVEEFVARCIGHDVARTRYVVERSAAQQTDIAARTPDVAVGPESPAVGR